MRFEEFWKSGAWLKLGKKAAMRHFNATVKTSDDLNRIQRARDAYAAHLALNPWKNPQHGATWFNNWQDWADWQEPLQVKPGAIQSSIRMVESECLMCHRNIELGEYCGPCDAIVRDARAHVNK